VIRSRQIRGGEPFTRATECPDDGQIFCPSDVTSCYFDHRSREHGEDLIGAAT
jgi:hypothetical protein